MKYIGSGSEEWAGRPDAVEERTHARTHARTYVHTQFASMDGVSGRYLGSWLGLFAYGMHDIEILICSHQCHRSSRVVSHVFSHLLSFHSHASSSSFSLAKTNGSNWIVDRPTLQTRLN